MIGRKKEISELQELYNSSKSQLIAVYGRRRVGKTYLVDETFKGRIVFRHAGLSPVEKGLGKSEGALNSQLRHFYNSLLLHGMKESKCPGNWLDAFLLLELFLESKDNGTRQLVFFDELPWMDTPKSGFITAFEGFWNTWGCHRDNLMVIVCGSATSWITDHLINNHGGLYNRLTYEIKVSPFTLFECEEYLKSEDIKLSRYDIVQSYMITGGIPYYLGYFQRGKSLSQVVDGLFFSKTAKLRDEFDRLFSSIFNNPEFMKSIILCLSNSHKGYSRQEIADNLKITAGGTLSKALKALIESDFVLKYTPFGEGRRTELYKLVDPFCMFYIKFVKNRNTLHEAFWQTNTNLMNIVAWRGFAFESVCFSHINQIKQALGISGVSTVESAWTKTGDDSRSGTQIDLIIDRKDNIINMCEIKFYGNNFTVNKEYYQKLLNRQELLSEVISPRKIIHNTLVTTFGLKENEYSAFFDKVITMDALFKEPVEF